MAIKSGIYAAAMSILNKDLTLDIESTIKHSEKIIEQGCSGIAIFGSTGQSQLISLLEKKKLIEKLNKNKNKNNFIVGTGENSLIHNVELMKHSIQNGINKFLIMPPAYYKYGDEDVHLFFSNIVERVPESEIILYNFEKLSGYKFSIQVVERLAKEFPKQIVGVKDSTYNLYKSLKIPNFHIFPGSETKLLEGLELGCSGIISAACNVTATLSRKVYEDFINKKQQTYNTRLCAIRSAFDKYNLISGLHSFLSIEDKKYKLVLPPLSLLSEKQQKELISNLKKLDFFPEKSRAA
jgi:4-hydroxy-tetrahydrodipicolinate synthase